jgi:hypothetical protein
VPAGYSSDALIDVFAYSLEIHPKNNARLHRLIYALKCLGFDFAGMESDVKNWGRMVYVFGYIKLVPRIKVISPKKHKV